MYTDIEEDNQELALLNAHIDSLKKQIAERDARKQEAMNAQPKTRVGWASYIIDNDRGLLDKYADAERAWQVAKKQNEYATQLADKQRAEQAEYNRDEWQLNLSKAQNEYTAASTALSIARKNGNEADINTAEQAMANAKASVDYWQKRLGLPTAVKKNDTPPKDNDEPPVSAESILATAKAEFDKNLTKKEIDTQMNALKPYVNQNGEAAGLYSKYNTKKSKEDKDFDAAVLKAAKKGNEHIWDLLDNTSQQELIDAARAKLSKGAKKISRFAKEIKNKIKIENNEINNSLTEVASSINLNKFTRAKQNSDQTSKQAIYEILAFFNIEPAPVPKQIKKLKSEEKTEE